MTFRHQRWTRLVCIAVLCFTSLNSQASDKVTLSIKPIACIVASIGQPCKLNVTAHWHAPQPRDLCLYQQDKLVHCWTNKQQGQKRFAISIVQSTDFKLLNSEKVTVATVSVAINAAKPDSYRRRLRADWSVF